MIPAVDEMARVDVFYIEQVPIVSVDDPKDKDGQALDTTTEKMETQRTVCLLRHGEMMHLMIWKNMKCCLKKRML